MKRDFNFREKKAVFDIECYRNFFMVAFLDIGTGKSRYFTTEREIVQRIINSYTLFSFNGIGYDIPILSYWMEGASTTELKKMSDDIIVNGLRYYNAGKIYGYKPLQNLDHVDLMNVNPGAPSHPSLKLIGGMIHSKTLKDLPFDPNYDLSEEEKGVLAEYCLNDLRITLDLYNKVQEALRIGVFASNLYGIDVRSKSNAQMAEAVFVNEVAKAIGRKPSDSNPPLRFSYTPRPWISFITPLMQGVFEMVKDAKFDCITGRTDFPVSLRNINITIGKTSYGFGIGGLHSKEAHRKVEGRLIDSDVTSFYPSIILEQKMFPDNLGSAGIELYRKLFDTRVKLKASGEDPDYVLTIKNILNGLYGKFGSPYSKLYAPKYLIQTTFTGQLALLMLIEQLEENGLSVVSANTDGIVTLVPEEEDERYHDIVTEWENTTSYKMEFTEYKAIYNISVNSYFALKGNGKVKRKGDFEKPGLKKNPDVEIVYDAVIEYLTTRRKLEDTIGSCSDVRKFLRVTKSKDGVYDENGDYIGKAVRWYYSVNPQILRTGRNSKLPQSDGGRVLQTLLSNTVPQDLDYDWYVKEAQAVVRECGGTVKSKPINDWKVMDEQKTAHYIAGQTCACGKVPKGLRVKWNDSSNATRVCKQCKEIMEIFE
jgi:hypothetical protein